MIRVPAFTFVPPALSMLLLLGINWETGRHVRPETAEPYHLAAKTAMDAFPYRIGDWVGRDELVPPEALELLREPNIISRTYINYGRDPLTADQAATLLVVQCRDSRDLRGHYPPVCYPANGMAQVDKKPPARQMRVGERDFSFVEYEFVQRVRDQEYHKIVYNFMVVPGSPIMPDMKSVERSAEDYQRRHYGAAQFQVVFAGTAASLPTPAQRDAVFRTFVAAAEPLIETLVNNRGNP